mmetsp:Transcript_1771/g.2466  ORF Transcript_1771/g.2466 Transcript_1771/m.2466 type:complete len:82 (+) Transcript_1771:144-389(+)
MGLFATLFKQPPFMMGTFLGAAAVYATHVVDTSPNVSLCDDEQKHQTKMQVRRTTTAAEAFINEIPDSNREFVEFFVQSTF